MMILYFYHVFVISFSILMNIVNMPKLINIPPLRPFSTVNNISVLVKRSNFTLVVFKAGCHANPGAVKKTSSWKGQLFASIY